MFENLEQINQRPRPFQYYTVAELWNDDHTSARMLACHLDPEVDLSSRNHRFIDRSVDWIIKRFNLGPGSRAADFGCGPGLYALPLAKTGATVSGIDLSVRSIDYARKAAASAGLTIDYINRNYLNYESDNRFDLIIMIMCDFCALSPEQRAALLAKFHKLLKPGGSVLLDVYSLAAFADREEQTVYQVNLLDGFWAPGKYYGFLNTFKYEPDKVVLDKYTIVEPDRTRTIYNWLQYFSREALEKEFNRAGLETTEVYADAAGRAWDPAGTEFAVVARGV